MEETLTDCLVRVREDLSNLSRVRNYLDTNGDAEEQCIFTWRTIEAFNSILGVCSSQNTPQTDALDTLLDSFYHLARNNTDPGVWNDFGFELGIICVKVLSAIEKSEIFEALFCKLLTVINVVSEHSSSVWKSSARQILNVFINKKFSVSYLETVLKLYICILRNIDSFALRNFSSQNLHLLKTFSLLVQRVGDFEIQSDIMEFVFLHLSNKAESMSDFFATTERKLFESLQFNDFEADCRTYLNAVNKPRGGFERKVYSVCCHTMYLGGCYVEPPIGTNFLWVDANKETERLSIRCADSDSESNRVVCIPFSDILRIDLSSEKSEVSRCLTIQTKSLGGLQFDVKNNEICLMIKNGEDLLEFVNFLKSEIKRKHKFDRKLSKTRSSLFIDRNRGQDVQDNAITSSEKRGRDKILHDILNLLEKPNPTTTTSEMQFKSPQSSRILTAEIKSPPPSQEETVALPSQELSPNSFVESLNQHIGSPNIPRTFEDSVETIEFLQRNIPPPTHKLFRSPEKVFEVIKTEQQNFNFIFDEDKENKSVVEAAEPSGRSRTYERKTEKPKPLEDLRRERVLRDRKSFEAKLANTQSQDYFQHGSLKKKKPSLPKLKRSAKARNQETKDEEKLERESVKAELRDLKISEFEHDQKENQYEKVNKPKKGQKKLEEQQSERKTKWEFSGEKKTRAQVQKETKPSLLDPNGYAFKRWCTPTTSERSNFWLKKLNAVHKSKTDGDRIFDFSDDSDSISEKNKRRKRRVIHSKRKCRTKKPKQTSFREVKEILRRTSPKCKQMSPLVNDINRNKDSPLCAEVSKSPECCPNVCEDEPQQSECPSICTSSLETARQNNAEESDLQSEDEEENVATKKRERSDEESYRAKTRAKKKSKTVLLSGKLVSTLRHRLQRKEQQDRQQTDEIVQTVNRAVGHLFNHLQRSEGRNVVSYLAAAEGVAAAVQSDVGGLGLRAKRIQRAMLYFQAGCSVSELCESVEGHFSEVRTTLKTLVEKKDVSKTIARVNDRLEGLIKSGIEKLIENEMATRRKRLLECASMFVGDCGDFP